MSGSASKIDIEMLMQLFASGYESKVIEITEINRDYELFPCERIVVCGGDGTFSNFLDKRSKFKYVIMQIIYVPYGTLNEKANGKHFDDEGYEFINSVVEVNEKLFSYVCATGTFTPLGYVVSNKEKKKFKAFAYISHILKQFKVYHIYATIQDENKYIDLKGNYSIIMILKNNKCFGLNFNRMYKDNENRAYLLTIKAPKHKNIFGKIKLFFSLFRAFFVGFNKEKRGRHVNFIPFDDDLHIFLEDDEPFCVDGELVNLEKGESIIKNRKLTNKIYVIKPSQVIRLYKQYYKNKK
jgi:diacylglycerol kinase family enzyme